VNPQVIHPEIKISLLQCRPLSSLQAAESIHLPENLERVAVVFSSHYIVPQGYLPNIRYVIFIPPENYFALPSIAARNSISRIIAHLNSTLGKKSFLCVGPGRWGTTNTDLGVFVSYADICNAGALVELAGKEAGPAPEPSLGTHFFQDLMEAQIYPVVIPLDDEETIFNREFFYDTPNCLRNWVSSDNDLEDCVRVIEVNSYHPGQHLTVVMDAEKGQAIAYLVKD
jgi:pyruvate,water dikinase